MDAARHTVYFFVGHRNGWSDGVDGAKLLALLERAK